MGNYTIYHLDPTIRETPHLYWSFLIPTNREPQFYVLHSNLNCYLFLPRIQVVRLLICVHSHCPLSQLIQSEESRSSMETVTGSHLLQ